VLETLGPKVMARQGPMCLCNAWLSAFLWILGLRFGTVMLAGTMGMVGLQVILMQTEVSSMALKEHERRKTGAVA
jgi:hypothetical protein